MLLQRNCKPHNFSIEIFLAFPERYDVIKQSFQQLNMSSLRAIQNKSFMAFLKCVQKITRIVKYPPLCKQTVFNGSFTTDVCFANEIFLL